MNKFKIIIPVYNSEKWIEKCLKILNDQTYKNWNAVIINDASHDETLIKIKKFFTSISFEDKSRYRVFDRKNNVGALKNIVDGIEMSCCEDEDIVILLDGDDYLSSVDVLEYLNQIYERMIDGIDVNKCPRCTFSMYNEAVEQVIIEDKMCYKFP